MIGVIQAAESIRVLLVDLPTMQRQLIERVLSVEPDMVVMATPEGVPPKHALVEADADAVVLGIDDPAVAEDLLASRPGVKVLTVVGDSRDLLLYELRPRREELGELTREKLVAALRSRQMAKTR
jgi:hypothetical protein